MLPKIHRFSSKSDIEALFRKGKKTVTPFFIIRSRNIPSRETHIAVLVSGKIAKKAVIRNKIKRRIRSILQELLPKMHDGSELTIQILSKDIATLPFLKVREEVIKSLEQAHLL